MATASAKLMITAEMTAAQVYREIDKVEQRQKKSTSAIAAHEQQVRRGSAFGGGQNAAYRVGMISQQAQDLAISMQMGMSASRVIAQQGSQIASIFGPKGMVIGGVIAIGAAMWDFASNTQAAEKRAAELADRLKKIESSKDRIREIENKASVSRTTMMFGAFEGEKEQMHLEYLEKQIKLRREMVEANKKKAKEMSEAKGDTPFIDLARNLFTVPGAEAYRKNKINAISEEAAAVNKMASDEMRANAMGAAQDTTEFLVKKTRAAQEEAWELKLAALISDSRAKEATEKDKEITEDLKREQDFLRERNKIRDSSYSDFQKNELYAALADARAAKDDEVAATRKKKRDEDSLNTYMRSVGAEVKMTEEKIKSEQDISQFRDTGIQKYLRLVSEVSQIESDIKHDKAEGVSSLENETKLAAKKLSLLNAEKSAIGEIETMQREGMEFRKAGLAGTDAQNKRNVIQMEIDLLNKKQAFSPIEAQQIANKLELLRREQVNDNFSMGGMGAGGMRAIDRNRKAQERAQERAEQRAIDNMGLIDIHRGVGGEIIGGTDPVTGKKLTKDEIAKRKADMEAEKARRDMERKAAAGDKEAQERLKRVRWGNEKNDGKIAAGFTDEQIAALSASIADAVLALQTK